MSFSEIELSELRSEVSRRLSPARMSHTLGVEAAAERIGRRILPDSLSELRAAALLHDISKEYNVEEQLSMMKELSFLPTASDLACEQIHHAYTAPFIIKRDFHRFATEDIISAVQKHTTGEPFMTLFDEIILLSDCIEEGRKHESAAMVRTSLYSSLDEAVCDIEALDALHLATVAAINSTLSLLIEKNRFIHEKTVATRNWLLSLINH